MNNSTFLPLNCISPENNDREDFSHVPALAKSISEVGLIQEITVKKRLTAKPQTLTILAGSKNETTIETTGEYEIIAGESRYQAHMLLGKVEIKVIIQDSDPIWASWAMLVENECRKSLNAIEQANAYQQRIDNGSSIEEIAKIIGRNIPYISNRLALLDLLPAYQHMVKHGQLGMSYTVAMNGLTPEYQKMAIDWLVAHSGLVGLSGFKIKCSELREKQAVAAQQGFNFGLFNEQSSLPMTCEVGVDEIVAPLDPETYTPKFSQGGGDDFANRC